MLDENKVSSTLFGLYPIPQLSLPTVVIYYLAQMIDLVGILGLLGYHPNLIDAAQEQQEQNNNNNSHKRDDGEGNVVIGKKDLSTLPNVDLTWTAHSICEAYAYKRVFMNNKGLPDTQRAAQQILYLVLDGRIQLYMLPPRD
eukprot:UN01777